MKQKSIATIHQQTLDLLSALGRRTATTDAIVEHVIRTHNRYLARICRAFGATHISVLTARQLRKPVGHAVYTTPASNE